MQTIKLPSIGDTVYLVLKKIKTSKVTCPECAGEGYLTNKNNDKWGCSTCKCKGFFENKAITDDVSVVEFIISDKIFISGKIKLYFDLDALEYSVRFDKDIFKTKHIEEVFNNEFVVREIYATKEEAEYDAASCKQFFTGYTGIAFDYSRRLK